MLLCALKTVGITSKNKHLIKYLYLPTAIRPVSHSAEIPVLVLKGFFSEILDHGPVFKESIYDTLTH